MASAVRLSLLVVLLSGSAAIAQDPADDASALAEEPGLRDLESARAIGMGGAYRALGIGGESVTGNPAAMSLYKRYMVDVSGAWDWEAKYAYGNATILDSSTNVIAAGVAYHFTSLGRGATRRIGHLNTLALSLPISDNISIGASGRHLLMTGLYETNAITLDAGLVVRIAGALLFGLSGHNLIDINNPDVRRYYSASLGWSGGVFNLAADGRADFGLPDRVGYALNFGGEYLVGQFLPIRAGYSLDKISNRQDLSVGVGFLIDTMGIDVAYRHELGGMGGKMVALTLRVTSQPER